MNILAEKTDTYNSSAQITDNNNNLSTRDLSDVSEAVAAVLRVVGFKKDHSRAILAALAEADGRTEEFPTFYARLGSRLKNKIDAYVSGEELEERNKTDAQRWRRAFGALNADQEATGFQFVACKPGSTDKHGCLKASKLTVDVEIFTSTIHSARQRNDFQKSRKFAFEEAAKELLSNNKVLVRRSPTKKMTSGEKIGRFKKTITNSARKLVECAVNESYDADSLWELKKSIIEKVDFAFYQAAEGLQNDTPQVALENEIDTILCMGVSLSDSTESVPPPPIESGLSGGYSLSDLSEEEATVDAALTALDVFSSVGVKKFNVFFTESERDSLVGKIEKELGIREVARRMPEFVERNRNEPLSLVFDMKSNGSWLLQVDEASTEVLDLLSPVSFAQIETSDGNGQAWLALPSDTSAEICAETKERLLRKLKPLGANCGASGGLRWVGTFNRKASRVREDGSSPVVKLSAHSYGRTVTLEELERLGLLAPRPEPLKLKESGFRSSRRALRANRVPNYQVSLSAIQSKADGSPDRSHADVLHAATCLDWGLTREEAVQEILNHSTKAKEQPNPYSYAQQKVKWAEKRCSR
jgi:hypothetical protein